MPPPTRKRLIKALLIGDSQVGKTQIINRFCKNTFSPTFRTTIGADFVTKEVSEGKATLQFWDTAGQERFSSLGSVFFRGSDFIVFVCSFDRAESLPELKKHAQAVKENCPNAVCAVIINKADLPESERKFSEKDVELTIKNNLSHLKFAQDSPAQVSAKTDGEDAPGVERIADVMQQMVDYVVEAQEADAAEDQFSLLTLDDQASRKKQKSRDGAAAFSVHKDPRDKLLISADDDDENRKSDKKPIKKRSSTKRNFYGFKI